MRLELHVKSPDGSERLVHEAGAISTLQREARKYNRHHPDNMSLMFTAYQVVESGEKKPVLIGTPRNTQSLSWSAPDARTEASLVAVIGEGDGTRKRVTGTSGQRRAIRDRD